jgi:hypothetical protein
MDNAPFQAVARTFRELFEGLVVPRHALIAVLILALGFALALLVERLSRKLIGKAAAVFARRGQGFAEQSSERVERMVSRTLYWIVIVLAVMAATETLGLPVVTTWLSSVASFLPRVAVAVVIAALGTLAGRATRHMITGAASSAQLPAAGRLGRLAQIAILVGTALVAIEQLGIEISLLKITLLILLSALLAGAALAFGLGSQHLVANILSAYYVQKLYQVGQTVRLEPALHGPSGSIVALEGRIARITDTAVIVESADGEVVVPAREITDRRSTLVLRTDRPR